MNLRKWNRRGGWSRRAANAALCMLVAAGLATPLAFAQDQDLPDAETILEGFVKACGGREAMEKHHNSKVSGVIAIMPMQINGKFMSYGAAPNKLYFKAEIDGFGKTERGTDGDLAWEISDMQGARILEGAEKTGFLRDSLFNSALHWREVYKSAKTIGMEDVNGSPCYMLKLVTPEGEEMTGWYDQKTGLVARLQMVITSANGEIPVEVEMDDYRDIDGVLVNFKTTQKAMGIEQVITYESAEWDVELPDDVFGAPDAIQRLLQKAASRPSSQPASQPASQPTSKPATESADKP